MQQYSSNVIGLFRFFLRKSLVELGQQCKSINSKDINLNRNSVHLTGIYKTYSIISANKSKISLWDLQSRYSVLNKRTLCPQVGIGIPEVGGIRWRSIKIGATMISKVNVCIVTAEGNLHDKTRWRRSRTLEVEN